jgi:hypothetical protein
MKFAAPATLFAFALSVYAQSATDLHIDTPPFIQQCKPILLTFGGQHPPFQLTAIPEGILSAAPLADISENAQGSQFTWIVNLQAGTSITLKIVDSIGASAVSGGIQVNPSDDSSCLGASSGGASGSSAPSTSAPGSASSAPNPSSTAPGGTASISTGGTSNPPRTSPSGSASGSATSTGSAATGSQSANSGAATSLTFGAATGLMGLLFAVTLG